MVDKLIGKLAGSHVFKKLDLRGGYHQLSIAHDDVFKTLSKTPWGHYEFLIMPFGLTNGPHFNVGWMQFLDLSLGNLDWSFLMIYCSTIHL